MQRNQTDFSRLELPEFSKILNNPRATPDQLEAVVKRLGTYDADGSPEHVKLKGCAGLQLHAYVWQGYGSQKGVIVLVHGIFTHARHTWLRWVPKIGSKLMVDQENGTPPVVLPKFSGGWIDRLNRKGYTVIAYDQQGFGLSEGWQGHRGTVEHFDDYAKDAQIVLKYARDFACQRPTTPVTFIGSSLGGAVCLRMLQINGSERVDNCILLAPMLLIPAAGWLAYPAAVLAKAFNPHGFLSHELAPSSTPEIEAAFFSDPLTFKGGLRYSVAKACLYGSSTTLDGANRTKEDRIGNLLVIHSEIDLVTDVKGSKLMMDKLTIKNKKIILLEKERGFGHGLAIEPGCEEIFEIVMQHIEEYNSKKKRASKS
eukprot:Selendium_serpulae@DN5649_c0_g1_i1.p1